MLKLSLRLLALCLQISFIFSAADQNRIKSLNVKCGDSDMLVDIEFNQPFNGIIFSKGFFARSECVYVKARPSKYSYEFTIAYSGCGTTAGGAGVGATGARRPDGFLRIADDAADGNATRSRRDITNSSAVPGPIGRSLGGWGGGSGMGGPDAMGDPMAASMQNQDYSGGGLGGNMMGGDPYAGGQGMGGMPGMGGMGGGMPGMVGGGGGTYGGGQPAYGGGQPGYGGGQQIGGNVPQQSPMGGGGQWNGPGPQQPQQQSSGAVFGGDQNQGQRVNVQSSVNANSQAGTSSNFASSFPDSSSSNGDNLQQQQSNTQFVQSQDASSQADNAASSSVLSKTNQPFGEDQTGGSSRFFENIIIIQYDANIQEVWDVAKALRCEWHDNYHKTVSYKPFQVDSLEVVPATFAGDNVGVWMTVQQGKGPYAPEVNGIVRIGEYLTLAIGIQDQTKKFDMRVINCFASDGSRPAIQLVDEYGCVTRPKIMSDLAKVTNYGDQASVVTYAYFQAFKFPDSVDVHLECSVEICKQGCAKQCYNKMIGEAGPKASSAMASISTGMHMGGARGQESRKVDTGELSITSDASDLTSTSSDDSSQSSSASASGKNVAVLSGARAASVAASKDSNMESVSSKIKNSLNGGKIVVKVGTKAPPSGPASAGAALYNAMGSDDDEVDTTTAQPTTTTAKASTKRSLKAKKVADSDEDSAYRRRRDTSSEQQQNVGIKRTIRVVAPGDLSFLETNRNNTVVYAGAQRIVGQSDVCIAPSSFVAGIVVLVALLVLTTLTAMILCFRLRSLDRVSNKLKDLDMNYIKHTL